jgi:hypothetical protein
MKQNFEIDSGASRGGQGKYMKIVLASLVLPFRQHC